eukprot:7383938-Pyramimonas_sp.AAC.1
MTESRQGPAQRFPFKVEGESAPGNNQIELNGTRHGHDKMVSLLNLTVDIFVDVRRPTARLRAQRGPL